MIILALETSMGLSSVAIRRADGRIVERFGGLAREQSESLLPLIKAVMEDAGAGFRELTRIAVTTGPGAFTGIRASLAAARGFALALDVEVIGVPSLEVMAHIFARDNLSAAPFVVSASAGRGMVYLQKFAATGAPLAEPMVTRTEDLIAFAQGGEFLLTGPGAASLAGVKAENLAPNASALAEMAAARAMAALPSPLYLRPADARPQQSKILARAVA